MKEQKLISFLTIIISGYFSYLLIIDLPNLFKDITIIICYALNINIELIVWIKIFSWTLTLILVLIIVYRYFNERIKILILNKEVEIQRFNFKSIILLGFIALASRVIRLVIQELQTLQFANYFEKLDKEDHENYLQIYLIDGYLQTGLSILFIGIFIYIIIRQKTAYNTGS